MKTFYKTSLLSAAIILILALSSSAQAYLSDPKFGPDEETRRECVVSKSLYEEHYKQRNYSMAKPYWQKVLQICPASGQNQYIHGVRMLKTWISETASPSRKRELIDSLMLIYDLRIEHFNRRGILLGSKGMDLISLDSDRYEEAYDYLKESVELEKDASESAVLYTLMVVAKTMYDNNKLGAEKVIETYALIADYLDIQLGGNPEDGRLLQVKENVDLIFSTAGVADCESLQKIFEPRIDANPNDLELIKKTYTLLSANRCEGTDFYRKTVIAFYNAEPTPDRAYELARIFNSLKEFDKVEEYYKQAIEKESDAIKKSSYLVEYAGIVFNEFKRPQQARTLALNAIETNPNMGHAFILIGNIYASEKGCFTDEFQKKTVFWAAVDKFIRAKQVDPSLATDCDRLIDIYSQYFPAQTDIFFQDLQPGQRYNVGCWINENTTVRQRP
jgi:tetratricopeptide (TPR) repeat protein